ncbi:hypothetical protein BGZ88_009669 [Linnemannia elongata]|uniref:Uncharacterized protein n=1 Tax=Linnemannia elongata AG-77 TaxID=1314771 RepID=A0A197K5V0_9FUNG|nr:hypothetical protein BGZ88_009669 [Linnemannia elongata]KAF9312659.1 hypothetical protein BGZ91_006474 [Linnemannia elongata]KAG0058008.1 hypothetical protein BGZ90_005198 [Linnemannia elongata]KAG0068064.1 hypothetical protein BGZ89_005293 [Linnemannia elongata]OAQ32558.1 hypothetical protein K457DRAFT_135109 [Linnemannia elongata AG-77]
MDVVRITQALRQQQQNPGRLNTTRTGGSSLVAASAGSSSTGETLHINTAHASMDNGVQTTPCSSPTPSSAGGNGGSGGLISPSSSFFSSLVHFLPGSAGVAAAATVAGAAGSSNVGEIESLLLRSMPMFGNLVSRD